MSILQMSIQAGVLIAAIVVVRAIALNKLPKITFLALWAVVLVRLLVPFSISSQFSIYTLADKALDRPPASTILTPGVALDSPAQVIGQQASYIDPLFLAWIIGMAAAFLFFAVVLWRNCRELRFAWTVRDNAFVDEWLDSHKLLRSLSVLQSDRTTTPVTMGYLRPRIILPKAMDLKDEQLLRYVLTHEYYHIRRFDAVWKLLTTFVLCVHWFNPLVWVMVILINRDLEITCDEMVVRHFGADTKAAYAYSLIGMAEQRSKLAPLLSGFSKNAAEERITAIMKFKKISVAAALLAIVLVMGMTAVFAASKETGSFSVGDTVIVQISADSVSDMYAYEFKLGGYDESAVKVINLHSAVDGINTIMQKPVDDYLLVGATKTDNSSGVSGDNMTICEIVMEVMSNGPIGELSVRDASIVDSAMYLTENVAGWDCKVVSSSSISQDSETDLDTQSDELPEPTTGEVGDILGEYSGQLYLGMDKQYVSTGETFKVEVSLSEPVEGNVSYLTCWFDSDELTYQGFDADGDLIIHNEEVYSGKVKITLITSGSRYYLDSLGSIRFMVSENSQLSGLQTSLTIVSDYVVKDGDDKNILSRSGEISVSIK